MKKQWKAIRGPIPTNGKLQLPDMQNGTRIYFDRLTGIFYRAITRGGSSAWSFYEPPKLRRERSASISLSSDERRPGDNEA